MKIYEVEDVLIIFSYIYLGQLVLFQFLDFLR